MHYSSIDYFTLGWIYPRDRLREPFPRRGRRMAVSLFAGTTVSRSTGTPERTFVAGPRGATFVPCNRGSVFSAPPRGVVFGGGQ